MKRGLTGHYVPLPSAAGENARAFVPNPLPPAPPLEELRTEAIGKTSAVAPVAEGNPRRADEERTRQQKRTRRISPLAELGGRHAPRQRRVRSAAARPGAGMSWCAGKIPAQ